MVYLPLRSFYHSPAATGSRELHLVVDNMPRSHNSTPKALSLCSDTKLFRSQTSVDAVVTTCGKKPKRPLTDE
jgi:hypothetical protein